MFLSLIAAATFKADPRAICEAPFAMIGGILMVEATVGTQKGWFFLDNGSPYSYLAKGVFDKTTGGEDLLQGAAGPGGLGMKRFPRFQVGGAALQGVVFMNNLPYDLPASTKSAYGIKAAGVLGYDILRRVSFGVDFDARQSWFWGTGQGAGARSEFFEPKADLQTIPISCQDGYPRAVAAFNGRPYYIPVDLGSTFTTAQAPATDWFGPKLSFGNKQSVNSYGHQENQRLFVPETLSFGGCQYLSPPCSETSLIPPRPCVLGWTLFLPLHRVLFDLDGGAIEYARAPQPINGCNPLLGWFGLQIGNDGQLHPVATVTGGLDHDIPLKDVVSIGGIPADQLSFDSGTDSQKRAEAVQKFEKVAAEVTTLNIVFKTGKHVSNYLIGFDPKSKVLPPPLSPTGAYSTGPGIYLEMPGTKPVKLDPGPDLLPEHGENYLVSVGGIRKPTPTPVPGQANRFTVNVPMDPLGVLEIAAMQTSEPKLTIFQADGSSTSEAPAHGPVEVPESATVLNLWYWTPVPGKNGATLYYPPGSKVPASSS